MLELVNLEKSYGKEQILCDISGKLEKGEILGIVGESGCGKSTLARQICGLENPTSGKVLFNGKNTAEYKRVEAKSFRRACQLILQDNLSSLDPTMTIGKTLHEVLRYNTKLGFLERQQKIEKALDSLFLKKDVLERFPLQLSGGERQRVNICRALLIEPEVLICDEITSSLDVITQFHLLKLLKKINVDRKLSIIFISHDINAVKSISDRIWVMNSGAVTEELNKKDNFAYTGIYAKRLLESLPINHPLKRKILVNDFKGRIFSSAV